MAFFIPWEPQPFLSSAFLSKVEGSCSMWSGPHARLLGPGRWLQPQRSKSSGPLLSRRLETQLFLSRCGA